MLKLSRVGKPDQFEESGKAGDLNGIVMLA